VSQGSPRKKIKMRGNLSNWRKLRQTRKQFRHWTTQTFMGSLQGKVNLLIWQCWSWQLGNTK
jgi:hypothetical protein